jgi:hypothetical protein
MTPLEQKLDIDNKRIDLQILVNELQSKIKVLENGMKYIDEGGDLLKDKGTLPNDVHKIMSKKRSWILGMIKVSKKYKLGQRILNLYDLHHLATEGKSLAYGKSMHSIEGIKPATFFQNWSVNQCSQWQFFKIEEI